MKSSFGHRFCCLAVVLGLVLCASASARDMVNLVKNPGFEDGMPEPWYVYHSGDYKLVRDANEAHSGQFFATFAWRPHPKGGYSALCTPTMKVYPGITYELGLWAKGRGGVNLWIIQTSKSGKFMGTDFGKKTWSLTGAWQHFKRSWTAPEGIYGASLFLRVGDGTVASFDDVSFSYDREAFTPPEAETIEVTAQLEARAAVYKLYLNNKPFDSPAKIVYGEHVISIEAKATGANPRLLGSIRFGDHEVELDGRWRAAPLPQGDAWRKAGFDDRKWEFARAADGIWSAGGAKSAAFRRVVLWQSSRRDPWRENQWVVMMRDRMYVPEDSSGGFVFIAQQPSRTPSEELTMHIEAPDFLKLLDRDEQASHWMSNYRHKEMKPRAFKRGGVGYVHYEITYSVPKDSPWKPYAPLYFKADEHIAKDKDYTFTFWREANGNITDVPMVLPVVVTGPVNGRQCKYFHLTYGRPGVMHSGGFGTYSIAERNASRDTLIDAGMNVAWVNSLSRERGVLDYYLSLKERGVHLVWGFNFGMNWPGSGSEVLKEHPDFQAEFYGGSKEAFEGKLGHRWHDMTGKMMWCQEYVAGGGKVFYDALRPRIEEAKKILGDILYVFWDWEYDTFAWSCFCPRCVDAFRKYAEIPKDVKLTHELIVTKYPQQWIKFRLDQSARHMMSMMEFCKEYGTTLTNWHPGGGIKCTDFDYSLLGDAYKYHFMGWPGSDLPLMGSGRSAGFNSGWKELSPEIHLAAQTIVDVYPSHIIDERMFKIWTLNIALGTHGGGWVIWLDSTYAFNQTHGQSYFMGEATRLINDFEEFFKKSKHIEGKFRQEGLKGRANELIALESPDGKEALVLLFNQSDKAAEVTVTVKDAAAGWNKVRQWERPTFPSADKVTVTVPEKDVIALHYK